MAMALVLLLAIVAIVIWNARRQAPVYPSAPVVRGALEASVAAIGVLQPRQYVDVGAQVSGQINRLHIKPGDKVAKGDLLVEIDPSVQQAAVDAGRAQVAGLRAQLQDQLAQHRLAQRQYNRHTLLAREGATRDEDVQVAEAAVASAAARADHLRAQIAQVRATLKADEARLGYTRIYAPMEGTVVAVYARAGQTLNAAYQTPNILRVADLSGMTVWTEVSEADIGRVKAGMPVYFTTLGAGGDDAARRWHGTVRQVLPSPQGMPSSGEGPAGVQQQAASKAVMYTVLFDVDNADGVLMPQMTAQVTFVVARVEDALLVPLTALVAGGQPDHYTVHVLGRRGGPAQREIVTGVRSRIAAQVVDGLRPGELVVTGPAASDGGEKWLQW